MPEPLCGNGIVEADELCDDGNNDDEDGCSADCLEYQCLVPITHPTMQSGIDDVDCTTVWIFAGTYAESLVVSRDVILREIDASEVVVDAGGQGRPITVTEGTVLIGSLRLTGGMSSDGGGIHNAANLTLEATEVSGNQAVRGGGIHNEGGTLTLIGARILDNTATTNAGGEVSGGGIYSSAGTVELSASTEISGNQALVIGASGMATGGGIALQDTSFSMSGGLIEVNLAQATGGEQSYSEGGGLYVSHSSATFDGVTIRDNVAVADGVSVVEADDAYGEAAGGGLSATSNSIVTMTRTDLIGNRAEASSTGYSSARGGGVHSYGGSGSSMVGFEFSECALEGNRAVGAGVGFLPWEGVHGGAVFLDSGGGSALLTVRLDRSLVAGNSAEGSSFSSGGGVYVSPGGGGTQAWAVVVNTTFSGNAAITSDPTGTSQGGAMHVAPGGGDSLLHGRFYGTTMTDNTAGQGGGLYFDGGYEIELGHTIVQGNIADMDSDLTCSAAGDFLSTGHNIVGATDACTIMGSGDIIGQSALLMPLGYNGGRTQTHAIGAASPAHDGGDPLGCTDDAGNPLTMDQRGEQRPAEVACDIGAFEYQP